MRKSAFHTQLSIMNYHYLYIPSDIISVICEYLDAETLWKTRTLNTEWNRIALNDSLWKSLYVKRWQDISHTVTNNHWWIKYLERNALLKFQCMDIDACIQWIRTSGNEDQKVVTTLEQQYLENEPDDIIQSTIITLNEKRSRISPTVIFHYIFNKSYEEKQEQKLIRNIEKMEDNKQTFNSKDKTIDLLELCFKTLQNSPMNITALLGM
jgi:hypothetical protein